ncbi:Neuroserpin Axonin-2 [Xyrichtys novacula]|uniref:Neuroserpin Axonin-2 n=1 Tax=Xyrichtys novacula TaxID=13765 RepID=A0AAV1FA29_XYRNO|nr:Neuroserpin Axonin-2 [Xyrichtys novacula]
MKSQTSKSTRSSQRSSASSTAVKAYAKARAARAQLVYAEKEANVMKQKADLEASLYLLQCQKAAAAAEAEANAYEEVESGEKSRIEDEPFDTVQRTSNYVHQQSERILSELPLEHMDRESLEEKADRMEISTVKSALPDTNNNTQPVHKNAKDERTTQSGPAELGPHPRPSRLTSPEKRHPPEPQG